MTPKENFYRLRAQGYDVDTAVAMSGYNPIGQQASGSSPYTYTNGPIGAVAQQVGSGIRPVTTAGRPTPASAYAGLAANGGQVNVTGSVNGATGGGLPNMGVTPSYNQGRAPGAKPSGGSAIRTAAQQINRTKAAASVGTASNPVPSGYQIIPTDTPNYSVSSGYVAPETPIGGMTYAQLTQGQTPGLQGNVGASGGSPATIIGPAPTQPGVTYLNLAQFQQLAALAQQMAAGGMQGPGPAYGQYAAPGVNMQTPAEAVAKAATNIGNNPYNVGQNTKENYDFLMQLLQEQVNASAPYTGKPV